MKKLILILAVSSMTSSAFAMHAYRSEVCTSKNLKIVYEGNYPIGGYYGLTKKSDVNGDKKITMIPLDEADAYEKTEVEEMVGFSVGKPIKIAFTKKLASDCYATSISKFVQKIKFENLKEADEKFLGIKNGQKILFKCVEEYDIPDQTLCEDKADR